MKDFFANATIEKEEDIIIVLSKLGRHPSAFALDLKDHHTSKSTIQHPSARALCESNRIKSNARPLSIGNFFNEYLNVIVCHKLCLELKWQEFRLKQQFVQLQEMRGNERPKRHARLQQQSKKCIVECMLCKKFTSKSLREWYDFTFCSECKGYICSKCNCQDYHLSKQKEIWDTIETNEESVRNAKRAKKKKRKSRRKERLTIQQTVESRDDGGTLRDEKDGTKRTERVDFVKYLEETKSVTALARLMDELEKQGYDFEDDMNDGEREV